MFAACTIISRNYLHFARTLCRSFLAAHPSAAFYVLLVDRPGENEDLHDEPFTAVWVEELGIPDFLSVAFKYNILELNTNVKASFLKWILSKCDVTRLIYLDPDIYVYSSLSTIDNLLLEKDITLTPHILSPIRDRKRPAEQDFLRSGVFNLGFIGVSNRAPAWEFLNWWEARCLDSGFSDQRSGLFVDQKWIDLVPCLFSNIEIIRNPGYNVAYWNIHERTINEADGHYFVNGSHELGFFHFSGIVFADLNRISKYQDRFTLQERRDLVRLFEAYSEEVLKSGSASTAGARYAFGYFGNGARISELARRVYAMSLDKFAGCDPFEANGAFFSFAKNARLLSDADTSGSYSTLNISPDDFRLKFIHICLRLARRMLGADRYTMLMKYLAHISILRNQRPLFWRD